MIAFTVRLRAEEPLVITSGSAESMAHETLGHIPGNMLLGAFAESWKRIHHDKNPDTSPAFRNLFLDGGVSWGMAVPLCGEESCVPLPRSYMRVKNHKGLPDFGEEVDTHTVVNMLRISDEDNLAELLRDRGGLGPDEALKLKKYTAHFMGRKSMRIAGEKRGWNIHVALGSQRSALDGQLFGYSSIAAGTEFSCAVICRSEEIAQELRSLLEATRSFHVGRSRSAGYGRVAMLDFVRETRSDETLNISAGQQISLFFLSHYVASLSWLQPMESLCEELEQLCGERPVLQKKFCSYVEIQGYNAMWKKPRASRTALEQGSVILCSFGKDVCLPRRLMLGGSRNEGYGRVELEPEFLDALFPLIPAMNFPAPEKKVLLPQNSPIWRSMRRRALEKGCEARAYSMLLEDNWREFICTASQNVQPGASQRGNIRRIITELPHEGWASAFCDMLEKSRSAGEQWKEAVAYSPFSSANDYLSDIMKKLLSAEKAEDFMAGCDLPGHRVSGAEINTAARKAHRMFILRLLAAWNHASLAGSEGRN